MNPFKFGTIVENNFFTDRITELEEVKQMLDSENHLVLISPRRFGKSSLICKALTQLERPSITIDMMQVLNVTDLASHIMRAIFSVYKMEKIRHLIKQFRIMPTISYKPMADSWDVSFTATLSDASIILEDAMSLLQKVTTPERKIIVVFDEFQEVNEIDKSLAKQLRAIMQKQSGLNYIFMGSQESMMEEIFDKKKSPFYHFGERMTLGKVPREDFMEYIVHRLPVIPDSISEVITKESIADSILDFTAVHPYYTQQLCSVVYRQMEYSKIYENVVERSIEVVVQEHDLDYERLWQTLNRNERRIIKELTQGKNPMQNRNYPTSTTFSSLKKLVKEGYIIKTTTYEIEDPFFGRWVAKNSK